MRILSTLILMVSLFIFMITDLAYCQTPNNNPKDWELIFEDHFDQKLDPNIWRKMNNYDHGGEPQMYTNRPKNARVEDGSLVIECHKEFYKDHQYTSGYVDLKKDYQFGYFEIRCKQPLGKGLWPAFWFSNATSTDDGWPPEIDVFETNGKDATFTSGGIYVKENGKPTKTFEFKDYQQSIDEWHTYAVDWNPEIINWYVDDQLIGSTTLHVPQILRRLVLNLALFPWDPPADNAHYFPARFEIDYIKIWKRIGGNPYLSWKEDWKNENNFSLLDWEFDIKDVILSADFTGNKQEELFIMNTSSKRSTMFSFEKSSWKEIYRNSKKKYIGKHRIQSSTSVFAIDYNGDGQDELGVIDFSAKRLIFMRLQKNTYDFVALNDFNFAGSGWVLQKSDQFIVGDFNGDAREEVLLFNTGLGKLLNFGGQDFEFNSVNGELKNWEFDESDQYLVGDFMGIGRDQLFIINGESKHAKLFNFENSKWKLDYENESKKSIGSWVLNKDDIFLVGDFDENGMDEILFANPISHHTRIYQAANSSFIWSNAGNPNIYYWNLHPDLGDKFISGRFVNSNKSQIFVVRFSGIENKAYSPFQNSCKAKLYSFMKSKPTSEKPKELPKEEPKENKARIIRLK